MEIKNQEEFNKTIKEKNALVYFFAQWCPPCKAFAPIFKKTAENTDFMILKKLDIDVVPEAASNYNIVSIPTLIIFQNGKEIDRCVGIPSNLENWIEENKI